MITMLDRDYSGKMGFNEFKELWAALNQWKVCVCARVGGYECMCAQGQTVTMTSIGATVTQEVTVTKCIMEIQPLLLNLGSYSFFKAQLFKSTTNLSYDFNSV